MKFKDIELDFDIFDADTAELYEEAVAQVQASGRAVPGDTLSATIRRQCESVFNFFDDLFGDGFHKKLFGERTNLTECVEAFAEFTNAVKAQQKALEERITTLNPHAPNRAERRAAARP